MRYEEGDRIYHDSYGLGTVLSEEVSINTVLIEFDNEMNGHNGDGLGEKGHCWWCNLEDIEEVDEDYYDEDDYCPPVKKASRREKTDWTVSVQENSQQDIILLLL